MGTPYYMAPEIVKGDRSVGQAMLRNYEKDIPVHVSNTYERDTDQWH